MYKLYFHKHCVPFIITTMVLTGGGRTCKLLTFHIFFLSNSKICVDNQNSHL